MEKMTSRVAPREDAIPWGLLTSLDIYGCNPEIIRDAEKIRQYVIELCQLIGMQRFGECHVVHFGKDERVEGHSMAQFIETSLISGHFGEHWLILRALSLTQNGGMFPVVLQVTKPLLCR